MVEHAYRRDTSMEKQDAPTSPDEATLLRLLADAARDFAIFAVEPDGTILTWNSGVRNITGYEEHEFIGRNCEMIFTPEDREIGAPEQEKETARRDGQAVDERWHLKKDGTRFWGSGFMHALYNDSGAHIGFAKILRDDTDKKHRDEELQALLKQRLSAHQDIQRRLLTTQEDERKRISREMHDQTGQHLAALGLELGLLENDAVATREAAATAARKALRAAGVASEAAQAAQTAAARAARTDPAPDAAQLAQVASEAARMAGIAGTDARAAAAAANAAMMVVDQAAPRLRQLRVLAESLSHDIHRLAVDLRPTSLDDLGLVAALRAYAEQCAATRAGAKVTVESTDLEEDGGGPVRRLPPDVETALYRIVQEAVTNAAKYAVPGGATQVSVTLQRLGGHVLATVEDNGPGFHPDETARRGRLGLAGMQERAELLGGTLEIESSPGSGTTVYARLPLPAPLPPNT
jgi:PAS domain S-box-containing protein